MDASACISSRVQKLFGWNCIQLDENLTSDFRWDDPGLDQHHRMGKVETVKSMHLLRRQVGLQFVQRRDRLLAESAYAGPVSRVFFPGKVHIPISAIVENTSWGFSALQAPSDLLRP